MIRRIPGCHVLRKIPIKKTVKKCAIGVELVGLMSSLSSAGSRYFELVENVANPLKAAHKNKPKSINWETAEKKISELNAAIIQKKMDSLLFKRQKAKILTIMNEDKSCNDTVNKNKVADYIVKISREYGVDPVQIACIAKQETHFTENRNGEFGKGMMQITSITTKDMYQRPQFFHKKLKEITSKYKNYKELYKALQTNPQLNMRVGVILYQARLNEAKGNIRTALINYNGSPIRYKYASDVFADIKKYSPQLRKSGQK